MAGPRPAAAYRRLLPFVRPYRGQLGATVAFSFVAAALDAFSLSLLIPLLTVMFGGDGATGGGPADGLNGFVGEVMAWFTRWMRGSPDLLGRLQVVMAVIVATVVLKNVFTWLAGQLSARLQEYVTRDLRDAVYSHLSELPLGYFQQTKGGQLLSRVMSDTQGTKALVTQLFTQGLQAAANVAFYLTFMLLTSWKLTLLSAVAAPALIGALQPLLKKLRSGYRRLGDDYGEITSVVQETVSGIRLVKSYSAEPYEQGRFARASQRYSKGMVRVSRVSQLSAPLTELAGTLVAVAVLWVGARDVLVNRTLTPQQLITFLIFTTRLLQPLKQLSQLRATAQQSLAAADRLFDVLDRPTERATDRGTVAPAGFERAVEFEGVGFAYDGEPVLRDVSFTARKGEVVALVGPSGAGKSTLVDLIPRFYEPTEGRILVDGVDTREIRLGALRALTGVVSQDTVLFNDTVRANIAYGLPGRFSAEQVEAAARAANAHAFIAELPQGYDTVLGERGTRLSGGQRQRIAIARALLVDPPILILDEATSALDTESERLVQDAIDRLLTGRTTFVIAHRLSTVEHATQILVLERGRVVERGTHAELLARRGAYHRLHGLQFRDAAAPAGAG